MIKYWSEKKHCRYNSVCCTGKSITPQGLRKPYTFFLIGIYSFPLSFSNCQMVVSSKLQLLAVEGKTEKPIFFYCNTHVLDARDPQGTRCYHLEKHLKENCKHKHMILLINKVISCDFDVVEVWRVVSCLTYFEKVSNHFALLFLVWYGSCLGNKKLAKGSIKGTSYPGIPC